MNDLTNQPAFPGITESFAASDPDDQQPFTGLFTYSGMTYRQWLAGLAMQGILANAIYMEAVIKTLGTAADNREETGGCIAKCAIAHADIVIAQLEKTSA